MTTLVCFHAHPDDETITTAGTMALAAAAGHRVVLVLATRGEQGTPVPGVLDPGEDLWARREVETRRSAELLGADRVDFLGYVDSGMVGEATNDDPACFWLADVDEAAARLAAILEEVGVDVLTMYDDHGGYGHPDHIQVHRVGRRAAELVGLAPARVFAATGNRDHMLAARDARAAAGPDVDPADLPPVPELDLETFGTPEAELTHVIDVTSVLDRKRASMQAHASQISPESFFLAMPSDMFTLAFGAEHYTCLGRPRPPGVPMVTDLFAEVRP